MPRNIREALRVDAEMEEGRVVRVLGISGSLRSASTNSALVRAAARLAPAGVEVSIYRELADIPPFSDVCLSVSLTSAIEALAHAVHARCA